MAGRQDIATPWKFFRAVEDYLGITFKYDMAASGYNTKCANYSSDSLYVDWPLDGWCWVNPPFSMQSKFIPKFLKEKDRGVKIVSLYPLSGDSNQLTSWLHSSVHIIEGRIWNVVRGCMLCVWDSNNITPNIKGIAWDKSYKLKQTWSVVL